MRQHLRLLVSTVLLLLLGFLSCQFNVQDTDFPDPLTLEWRHVQNQYEGKSQHLAELTITNKGDIPLSNEDWALYFNWFRRLMTDQMDERISGQHINGDFYSIAPTAAFPLLEPGVTVTLPVIGEHYEISRTDAPSGAYFVWKDREGKEHIRKVEMQILPFDTSRCYRSENDIMPVWNPAAQYVRNLAMEWVPLTDEVPGIIPTPVRSEYRNYMVALTSEWSLEFDPACREEAEWFTGKMEEILPGFPADVSDQVVLLRVKPEAFSGEANRPEAYQLEMSEGHITITGHDAAGVFYGLQTLRALQAENQKQADALLLPACSILDYPRFAYRGMHIDVARNFHDAQTIKELLDILSYYKLNRLHFHLTDDEGWRVEIPGLPELTEVGAVRGHTSGERAHLVPSLGSGPYTDPEKSAGSGYYSRDTFITLLKYADERHMEVIPEIDVPGHAHAAIFAMNVRYKRLIEAGDREGAAAYLLYHPADTSQYMSVQKWKNNAVDPGMESTYRFFEKVVAELDRMYREAGLKLNMLHIGGDEVSSGAWKGSPACKALMDANPDLQTHYDLFKYFVDRVRRILDRYDIRTAGWEEVGMEIEKGKKVPNANIARFGVVPYVWNSVWGWGAEDLAYRMANQGFDVVLSNVTNLYLDLAYNKHPEEPGLYWGGFVDTRTAWELTPMDVRLCAEIDVNGHPVNVTSFDRFQPLREGAESNIIGIQGQVWGENTRSVELLHYMMFPKTLGVVERAWAQKPVWEERFRKDVREEEWRRFVTIAGMRELPRLARQGIAYRIPPPGAVIKNDSLYVNNTFPGFTIVYKTSEQDEKTYSGPVYMEPSGIAIQLWNRDGGGRESRKVNLVR